MNPPVKARRAVVLLVEDDPDHAFLAREGLIDAHVLVDLHHVERGDQALAFLRRQAPYQDAPRPDLILLDLHLPRVSGYEVMEAIAADESLKSLPVVVLTSSSDAKDVQLLNALGCTSFITKPLEFADLAATLRKMAGYWFELVIVEPPHTAARP
jgi:CheY-like chemotaxis protein